MQYGHIYYCILFLFFFNFHKLLCSSNEVLYLQKQPLVGTLQKQLLLILNIFTVLWSLLEIICFLWSTSVVLLEYFFFWGGGVFEEFCLQINKRIIYQMSLSEKRYWRIHHYNYQNFEKKNDRHFSWRNFTLSKWKILDCTIK